MCICRCNLISIPIEFQYIRDPWYIVIYTIYTCLPIKFNIHGFESFMYTLLHVKEKLINIFILDIVDHDTMCVFASIGTHVAYLISSLQYHRGIWAVPKKTLEEYVDIKEGHFLHNQLKVKVRSQYTCFVSCEACFWGHLTHNNLGDHKVVELLVEGPNRQFPKLCWRYPLHKMFKLGYDASCRQG